ncbi:hypothetical protein KC19_VG138100 [Ceratodon purpureus]|uniref:Uncharacterized protein n=1 Tax=Ceratodon purpureus TaxID=3225 RepID=A0A8T0HQG1_CERPU|nr:hypothetical protein KC19_VG138100 [Ceratodon purpureus]
MQMLPPLGQVPLQPPKTSLLQVHRRLCPSGPHLPQLHCSKPASLHILIAENNPTAPQRQLLTTTTLSYKLKSSPIHAIIALTAPKSSNTLQNLQKSTQPLPHAKSNLENQPARHITSKAPYNPLKALEDLLQIVEPSQDSTTSYNNTGTETIHGPHL